MSPSTKLLLVAASAAAILACSTARDQSKGFRLAANGDIHRGKAAFLEFGCNQCHEVKGAIMPAATVQRVILGGSVVAQPSDGYLVTAIINPAYHATRYPQISGGPGAHPGMPEFAPRMTVQQLTDIVAYLQSRYALRPMQVPMERVSDGR